MARARAWAGGGLPRPGTPSISKCPRARTETRASRMTSSLPRITLRSAFSSCVARWDEAIAVSGDMEKFYYAVTEVEARPSRYERHILAISCQLSAIRKIQSLRAFTDG